LYLNIVLQKGVVQERVAENLSVCIEPAWHTSACASAIPEIGQDPAHEAQASAVTNN
jgi:hypothetical protein